LRRSPTLQKRSVTRTDRFQNQMVVTGDSFPGVRFLSAESARMIGCTALPQQCHPLSGFLTLSAVCSHPDLVALFHATSAPRILVFRAFPSSPAAISFDIRCSLVVSPAPRSAGCPDFRFALAVLRLPRPSSVGNSAEILSCTSVLYRTSSWPTINLR